MDDGDGPRSPARRRAPAGVGQPLRGALVAFAAAGILAIAVLAAALASPPASADAAAQPEPTGVAASGTAQSDAAGSGGDRRTLAWWMAGEVSVLVVGGAIWCRRSNRRQSAHLELGPASGPTTPASMARRRDGTANRPHSARFRL